MSGFAIHVGYRRKIDKLCMALSRVILSFFLDISLLTIFTYRIYSYTPVDARYFPKGGVWLKSLIVVESVYRT